MRYVIGIDPGFNGGIAVIQDTVSDFKMLRLERMPLRQPSALFPDKRNNIDSDRLREIFIPYANGPLPCVAVMEKVSASPQMGVTSAFRFGEGFGLVCGVLSGLNIQIRFVYPNVWKPALGLSVAKRDSLVMARKKFPSTVERFKLAKDDGLAEAALLAYYGFSRLKEGPESGS